MPTLGRIIFQIVASGPLMVLYPILLFSIGLGVIELFTGTPEGEAGFGLLAAGGLALTGLYASILLPIAWLRRHAWLRWTTLGLMFCGVALAAWLLAAGWTDLDDPAAWASPSAWIIVWFFAWMFGGPVLVAAWNTWRMLQKTPIEEVPA